MKTINSDLSTKYHKHQMVEPENYGDLTVLILKARYYAQFPEGIEFEGERLSFEDATEASGDNMVDAVWGEWANMPAGCIEAQHAILAAVKRKEWTPEDWAEYRKQQKIRQEREQVVKARIKQEAAARTAKLAQVE